MISDGIAGQGEPAETVVPGSGLTAPLLRSRIAEVRRRIDGACLSAGRLPSDVTLIGVSKTMPAEVIDMAVEAGLEEFGENYVAEAREKAARHPEVRWHLIGHLQRNKAGIAAKFADVIHSLDSLDIIRRIDRHCAELGRHISGLLEVHLGGESSKTGIEPGQLFDILEQLAAEPPVHLSLTGLMTIPPPCADSQENRPYFRRLREMLEEIRQRGYSFWKGNELSMGMSGDYEAAVAEGATFVRVGRAIFGDRPRKL